MAIFPSLVNELAPLDVGANQSVVAADACISCGSKSGPYTAGTAYGSSDAFAICKTCVVPIAEQHGWTPPGNASSEDALRQRVQELEEAVEQAHEDADAVAAARKANAGLLAISEAMADVKDRPQLAAPKKAKK